MTRAAIIGTGWIAHEHVLALRGLPDVEVVAASSDSGRADRFAAEHGIRAAVPSHKELLARPDVDVVHICTKNIDHAAQCRRAIDSGKHVVAEKPLATSSEETRSLLDLATRRGIVHACNYNYRAYPVVQHALKLVAHGDLGEVRLVQGAYRQDWLFHATDYNWRLDPALGGISAAFGDIGTHWFDLLEHITGRRVVEVFSRLTTALPKRVHGQDGSSRSVSIAVDDSGVVSFSLDNGGIGSVLVSQVAAGHKNGLELEVHGSRASLFWSQEAPDQMWIGHRDGPNHLVLRDSGMAPDEVLPPGHPFGWRDALRRNIRAVYARIAGEHPSATSVGFATFADGHRSLELLEAVVGSARINRPLAVDKPQPAAGTATPVEG
jgi:predicted dehydrogenase